MGIFKSIKDWFFPPYMKEVKSLTELVGLIPVGDLDALCEWMNHYIPYHHDVDENGKYDKTQNYNGADLTIIMKRGDCESKAAVCSEVIRWWKGWKSGHTYFRFIRNGGQYEAHDICWFITPSGKHGWIEGIPHYGDTKQMIEYYAGMGWKIDYVTPVNDIGQSTEA